MHNDAIAAQGLANLRRSIIADDRTVKIIEHGDDLILIEAELLYLDLSARTADVDAAQQLLLAAGGQPLSSVTLSQRSNSDNETAGNTLAHFHDKLRIQIWDLSGPATVNPEFDVTQLIATIRAATGERPVVRPVTVYTKAPWDGGGWGTPVAAAAPATLPLSLKGVPASGPIRFAVLDAGMPLDYGTTHPYLQYTVDASDNDTETPIYTTPPDLIIDAGHGQFIWDIAYRQAAPLAPAFLPRVMRDASGLTVSEIDVVARLAALVQTVVAEGDGQLLVNMSFSGLTDDTSPFGLGAELQWLQTEGFDVLVVAAAGNDSSTDLYWPAAFAATMTNVVSVGALTFGTNDVACFSNHGPWVECWAYGTELTGAYLVGSVNDPSDPGGDIVPLVPGTEPFATWQGTSFATPRVAAAIANQAFSAPGQTLVDAWNALQAAHAGDNPTWTDTSSGATDTEKGVNIE